MLILWLSLLGLGSKSISLGPLGSVYVCQGSIKLRVGSLISFLDFLFFFPGWLFWPMESINVTGILQEAGNADSRVILYSKCKLIISSVLTLPHLLDCLICTRNTMTVVVLLQMMRGNEVAGGGGWFILGYELGYREWVSAYSFCCFFSCAFVICSLTFLVPLFRWIEHDDYNFCSFVFFVSGPFNKDSQVHRGCSVCWLCLLCKTSLKVRYVIIILWISLEKGACFDYNHSWECVYPSLYIIRFLGQVYHFSLLICYPYSF